MYMGLGNSLCLQETSCACILSCCFLKEMMVKSVIGLCKVRNLQVFLAFSLLLNAFIFLGTYIYFSCSASPPPSSSIASRQILFVGGCPRSGTTLARAMLDAHPDVRCGEETRVIPRVVGMRTQWDSSEKEHMRLEEARLSDALLDQATAAFISEIILHHGEPAKFLCNKDPLVLSYMGAVVRMFPKAKFVLMIRDGRAVAYSIISRNVSITGVDSKSYLSAALFWNRVVSRMVSDCTMLGKERCLMVRYEKLVQNPKTWMEKVLKLGGIPWNENVLHHNELIDKEVFLST